MVLGHSVQWQNDTKYKSTSENTLFAISKGRPIELPLKAEPVATWIRYNAYKILFAFFLILAGKHAFLPQLFVLYKKYTGNPLAMLQNMYMHM